MPIERNAKNVATATSRKAGVSTRACALVASVIRARHYRRRRELRDAGAARVFCGRLDARVPGLAVPGQDGLGARFGERVERRERAFAVRGRGTRDDPRSALRRERVEHDEGVACDDGVALWEVQ